MLDEFENDELDFPTEEGCTTIAGALGMRMLWNKADIVLEEKKLASKPSEPLSSPPGGPSDKDDGNRGDDNGSDGPSNSPGHSPPPDMNNQQGGPGGAPGNETPPPTGQMGTRQCPPAPTDEADDKPAHLTTEEWAASCIAEDFTYTTAFDR